MEGNLEALRARLERLLEVARPDDRLRLKHTITLIRLAETVQRGAMSWTGLPSETRPETHSIK
jgi:hypothetical protein